ncbi:MAG: thiamine phosphate synthase [Candidatus Binatia bacterium]
MTAGPRLDVTRAPRLMVIVDTADVMQRRAAIEAALAGGVDTVQLRDRRAQGGPLLAAARVLRALTYNHEAALLVNDRIDVAIAADADGVHLPSAAVPTATARRLLGPKPWIGRSTHAATEATAAAADGADYVVLGPIFATPSKEQFGPPLGITAFTATASTAPLIAIGGITPEHVAALRTAGAHGVAIIRALLDASDPAAAARAFRSALGC